MTIEFKIGNILEAEENLICHQVNYQGAMNSGLAKQIRNKFPKIYKGYREFISKYSFEDIRKTGRFYYYSISYSHYNSPNKVQGICNIFGQEYYGRDKCYTDYVALKNALEVIKGVAEINKDDIYSVAIPYGMSSGLAGGSWEVVYKIIQDIFENSEVKCVIYKLEGVE